MTLMLILTTSVEFGLLGWIENLLCELNPFKRKLREHIDSWSKPLDITVILVNESMFSQTSVRIIFSVFSFLLIGRHDYFDFGDNRKRSCIHSITI